MSKRFIFQQQHGERKKAKLDVTISDHNFPLSQNGPRKAEPEDDNWGDDKDDEILLLASQACEDAYNDVSLLPDYSICMQPGTTSTQLFDPGPSTSKTEFAFKKPSSIPTNVVSTNLKDKCNRISSPLPGMSMKMVPKSPENINMADDLIISDKIYKGQDSEYVYKQLLQLQEENAKLKSENGKLLEKCVTKEGEASILRTQLKTCQIAVDNARMEKIKAQEKVQMEWTEKLAAANGQMHDLRNQLDFKNLEIISIKEKCKMLESNKVKLTQVTVANNDYNASHRNNSTISNDYAPPVRKTKLTSNAVQTDDKAHFIRIHKTYTLVPSALTEILPLILESTAEQHSILECNEKLQKHTDLSQNKCRIYSTFHRVPRTLSNREHKRTTPSMNCLYEDIVSIASRSCDNQCFSNILSTIKTVLLEVKNHLEVVSQKMTTAFQREMDEKYIEATSSFIVIHHKDLLCGRQLFDEEQGTLARRMTALLSYILKDHSFVQLFIDDDHLYEQYLELLQKISSLLDSTSCALLYSGILLSITILVDKIKDKNVLKISEIIKNIINSRPMPFVSCQLLRVLRKLCLEKRVLDKLCPGGSQGNLKLDYDQGVLLYKKDSCSIQVLLKQIEAALKCIDKQRLVDQAIDTTRHLVTLYCNINNGNTVWNQEKSPKCDCQLILLQTLVYALCICAVMLTDFKKKEVSNDYNQQLVSVCRCGIHILYQCIIRDVEFTSQLAHNEGHLMDFCELMRDFDHSDHYLTMLTELTGTFQSSPEESTSSFSKQPWINSFDNFTISD